MSDKIHVQCYKCKTVYELEYSLRGQLVECAVCDAVFEVPQLGEKYKTKTIEASVSVENEEEKVIHEGEDPNLKTSMGIENTLRDSKTTKLSTKTIRLPRAREGMLPKVEDKFGAEQVRNPLYHKKMHSDPKEALENFAKSQQAKSVKETPKNTSKWWPWGKKKK
jgi:hypothetical protein